MDSAWPAYGPVGTRAEEMLEEEPPHERETRLHCGPKRSHVHRQERGAAVVHAGTK